VEAWRSVLENLARSISKEIRTDILGGIFKRLIAPEERQQIWPAYTNEDLVDAVNAFCIRYGRSETCSSGGRLGQFRGARLPTKGMAQTRQCAHQDWLRQIYAVDISLFCGSSCTLNLAARDIRNEENYPRVRRGIF